MKAVVVYESHWGNTQLVASAIAEGIGPEATALSTDEASPETIAEADLVVAGAPVIAFGLASERSMTGIAKRSDDAPRPADVSHEPMRAWLDHLPNAHARSAAFETRLWWSPRGAAGTIERGLEHAGLQRLLKAEKFVVTGTYGPLREGELERAHRWGTELAAAMELAS